MLPRLKCACFWTHKTWFQIFFFHLLNTVQNDRRHASQRLPTPLEKWLKNFINYWLGFKTVLFRKIDTFFLFPNYFFKVFEMTLAMLPKPFPRTLKKEPNIFGNCLFQSKAKISIFGDTKNLVLENWPSEHFWGFS